MILAFEGLPAVGKSTTAGALASQGRAYVIPEVNRLFFAPRPCTEEWYFDRQVARWEMAARQVGAFERIIFDGDPFQPLWFNWIFSDEGCWAGVADVLAFYRRRIAEGRIAFPDVYVYFRIDREELRRRRLERDREEGTETVERKFRKYVRMERPLDLYFRTLAEAFPDRVVTLNARTIEHSVATIGAIPPLKHNQQDERMLEVLQDLLEQTPPQE